MPLFIGKKAAVIAWLLFIYVLMPIFTLFVNYWCIGIYKRCVFENLYLLCTHEDYECIFYINLQPQNKTQLIIAVKP